MKRIQLLLIASLFMAAATISSPRDPGRYRQAAAAVQAALIDGDYKAQMVEMQRLLELHPNDPRLRAYFYRAMGVAAGKAGATKDAELYTRMAQTLDWGIDARVEKPDSAAAIMSAATQTLAVLQNERVDAKRMPGPAQSQAAQDPKPTFSYPRAPSGAQGYTPPAQSQPMPGFAAAIMSAPFRMPSKSAGPPSVPGQPNSNSVPSQAPAASSLPPPLFQPNPDAQPPPGFPQPTTRDQQSPTSQNPPQQFPTSMPAGGPTPPVPDVDGRMFGGGTGGPPIGYQKPVDQYIMQQASAAWRQRRGEAAKPLRVVHDHSQLGDEAYFETGCGALLSVEDGALIYTSGVEVPRLIVPSEIVELRMNEEVGRAIGAFHILTRRGLFLNLAPEGATREQGRLFVESLRKQLGLGE